MIPRHVARIALLLALASLAACTEVHQTDRCIGTRYGKVVEEKMDVGLNLTMFETANCFPMTDQNYPLETGGKETMDAQTRDPMTVSGDIAFVYAFDPATVYDVFLEKRSPEAAETQVLNAVRDGYRAAMAGWSVTDLFSSHRASLGDSIRAHIQSKLMMDGKALATIKQVYVRDIRVPAAIEAARVAATNQALILDRAQKQLAIDSMNARGQVITATAQAEANRLSSQSYAANPKMLDVKIAESLAGICHGVTTCIIGASPNSLLGLGGLRP